MTNEFLRREFSRSSTAISCPSGGCLFRGVRGREWAWVAPVQVSIVASRVRTFSRIGELDGLARPAAIGSPNPARDLPLGAAAALADCRFGLGRRAAAAQLAAIDPLGQSL